MWLHSRESSQNYSSVQYEYYKIGNTGCIFKNINIEINFLSRMQHYLWCGYIISGVATFRSFVTKLQYFTVVFNLLLGHQQKQYNFIYIVSGHQSINKLYSHTYSEFFLSLFIYIADLPYS